MNQETNTSSYGKVSADAIKAQREALANGSGRETQQTNKVAFDPNNYLDTRLKDGEQTRTVRIRILPISDTNSGIFFILNTHQMKVDTQISQSGFKSYICLNDDNLEAGEAGDCPLCRKAEELLAKSVAIDPKDTARADERKELFKKAMAYKPKQTFIVRVIDRDKENEGVKFWRFNAHTDGKGYYDLLMALFDLRNKESVDAGMGEYNIFDLDNGKDIVITLNAVDDGKGGTKTVASIMDAGMQTPLSRDPKKYEEWVKDKKTWRNLYAIKSEDYLSIVADEEIPVFDKVNNRWTAKKDFTTQSQAKEEANKAYAEGQKQAEAIAAQPQQHVPGAPSPGQAADDLPF